MSRFGLSSESSNLEIDFTLKPVLSQSVGADNRETIVDSAGGGSAGEASWAPGTWSSHQQHPYPRGAPFLAACAEGNLAQLLTFPAAAWEQQAVEGLFIATERGQLDVVRWLVRECGVDPSDPCPCNRGEHILTGSQPARAEVCFGQLAVVKFLVVASGVWHRTSDMQRLESLAEIRGYSRIAEWLATCRYPEPSASRFSLHTRESQPPHTG